jgi:hypothetical protein
MRQNELVFVLGNPFQPVLILAGKARSLPKSGTPEQCPIQTGPGIICKYLASFERFECYVSSSVTKKKVL